MEEGLTIFDVVDDLKEWDIILKGANALDISSIQAGVLISDPHGGTIGAAMQAAVGRRVRLIHPVGLEKRVSKDLNNLARLFNAPGTQGPRLLPTTGEVFTEIDANFHPDRCQGSAHRGWGCKWGRRFPAAGSHR